jgi:phospholipase C
MYPNNMRIWRTKISACASATALSALGLAASANAATDPDNSVDAIKTATPIKHVIIIVGENRSFDHLFATYVPKSRKERVLNLLAEKIINADGTPGPNFARSPLRRMVENSSAARI